MMDTIKFREVIKMRVLAEKVSDGEWYEEIEKCWSDEIEILSENIQSSIYFLENECTADEYSWISEVLDDIVEQTGSSEFLKCYKKLMTKFPEECEKYNIIGSIEFAEEVLASQEENAHG